MVASRNKVFRPRETRAANAVALDRNYRRESGRDYYLSPFSTVGIRVNRSDIGYILTSLALHDTKPRFLESRDTLCLGIPWCVFSTHRVMCMRLSTFRTFVIHGSRILTSKFDLAKLSTFDIEEIWPWKYQELYTKVASTAKIKCQKCRSTCIIMCL